MTTKAVMVRLHITVWSWDPQGARSHVRRW